MISNYWHQVELIVSIFVPNLGFVLNLRIALCRNYNLTQCAVSLLLCLSVIAFISCRNMLSSEALSDGVGSDLKHSIMQLVSYCVRYGNVILIYMHIAWWSLWNQAENSFNFTNAYFVILWQEFSLIIHSEKKRSQKLYRSCNPGT